MTGPRSGELVPHHGRDNMTPLGRHADDGDTPDPAVAGFAMAEPVTMERQTAVGFLLDALRARRTGRRFLSGLTALLFLAGAGMFTYPFFTDLYTEEVVQRRLEDQFADQLAIDDLRIGDLGGEWAATVAPGRALTRMIIPRIGVDTIVVEGTSPDALRAGAGHYPSTPLPGEPGNVAIAGHRTTYGKPLNRADELQPGDEVWLLTPVADHRYVLPEAPEGWDANPYITGPKDWSVVAPTSQPSVTLTTCHPKGSAAQRLIVRAVLAESLPPGSYSSG